jgi:hypothetical protein
VAFRDELEAAQARADALQRRVDELEVENRRLRGEAEPQTTALATTEPDRALGTSVDFSAADTLLWGGFSVVLGGLAAGLIATAAAPLMAGVCAFGSLLGLGGAAFTRLRVPPRPGWIATIHHHSGGYQIVPEGSDSIRRPGQRIEWLDVRPRSCQVQIERTPLADETTASVELTAQVAPTREPPGLQAFTDRFVSRPADEFATVAAQTLESHMRNLLGRRPAPALDDRATLLDQLATSARHDLAKLGLELEELSFRDLRILS